MDRNVESLYLCGLSAFVLSNGFSLALFVGGMLEHHVLEGKINVEGYM